MLFKTMMENLQETAEIQVLCSDCRVEITDVALIDGRQEKFSQDVLYFGFAESVSEDSFPAQCVLAGAVDETVEKSGGCGWALSDPKDLFCLFNRAKSIIDASRERGLYGELMDCAARSRSIEPVINLAAARLNNSVVLVDSEFKVLSHSTIFPIDDPLWEENIRHGYCSYEFVSAVKQIPEVRDAKMTSDPVVVTCAASPLRKLSSKIFIDGKLVGILIMLEKESPITPDQIEILPVISRASGDAMARYAPFLIPGNTAYEKLLHNLLIGAPSESVLQVKGSLSKSSRFAALCIRQSRYLGQKHLRQEVSRDLLAQFPKLRFTYHEGGIAAVLPLGGRPSISADEIACLERLAEAEHLRIGISDVFLELNQFARRYAQAKRALELSSRMHERSRVIVYTSWSFYDLLDHLQASEKFTGQSASQLGMFCHPALSILNRYDVQNKTELYHTLDVFLRCDGILKDAADALYIHRNSLRYRMERIQELTGVDLTDGSVRFLLQMSFQIDRFTGKEG
jgi:hypothetical protein